MKVFILIFSFILLIKESITAMRVWNTEEKRKQQGLQIVEGYEFINNFIGDTVNIITKLLVFMFLITSIYHIAIIVYYLKTLSIVIITLLKIFHNFIITSNSIKEAKSDDLEKKLTENIPNKREIADHVLNISYLIFIIIILFIK